MSRLPVPAPGLAPPPSMSSVSQATMKRKHTDDDDGDDHPRKLSNSGSGRPLRASKHVPNAPAAAKPPSAAATTTKPPSVGPAPAPLTKPRAPSFSSRPARPASARATSLPPRSVGAPVRPPAAPRAGPSRVAAPRSGAGRGGAARTVSGGFAPKLANVDEAVFGELQALVHREMDTRDGRIAADMDTERAKIAELQASQLALSKDLATAKTAEITRRKELDSAADELDALKKKHTREMMDVEMDMRRKDREIRELKEDLRNRDDDIEAERARAAQLKATVSQMSTTHMLAESQRTALEAQLSALQSARTTDAGTVSGLRLELEGAHARVAALEADALAGERLRRALHNTIQELKGNIRVFCRVRPLLEDGERAQLAFPDRLERREIVLQGASENAMGQARTETWEFACDRVFEPESTQADVFEEVSQLAQSVTDGFNVCIFAYGQTGSGKSFTMEGGSTETSMGMIPRAVEQVFRTAEELRAKGWEYTMEGQFLEIYNETVHDLLGTGEDRKHDIKHDARGTRVTDAAVLPLRSPAQVRALLARAQGRRSVAATLMNERSSRSHSVFTLRVAGTNAGTGERCDASLNLVDLAGSERLNASGAGADRERLRETQNINRSLSALGDVIAALGEKGERGEKHIPYRNSKLTYLLQNSLSGNSKTLMILNVSPLAASLGETLCSLRFATKVNNTTIGTAKRQIKKDAAPAA